MERCAKSLVSKPMHCHFVIYVNSVWKRHMQSKSNVKRVPQRTTLWSGIYVILSVPISHYIWFTLVLDCTAHINHHISVYYSFPFIIIYVYITGTNFSLYYIYLGFRLSNTNTYLSSCVCILSVPISHYIGFTLFLDYTAQICRVSIIYYRHTFLIIYVYIIDTRFPLYRIYVDFRLRSAQLLINHHICCLLYTSDAADE